MISDTTLTANPTIGNCTCLIGAGTVGRAILEDHLRNGLDVVLADLDATALDAVAAEMSQRHSRYRIERERTPLAEIPTIGFFLDSVRHPRLCIESIPENLAMKQALFRRLRTDLGSDVILASNTSNLRIEQVFAELPGDPLCCGMHFFMPVSDRPLIEFIATTATDAETQRRCTAHADLLHKQTLCTSDSPGFVVNRLLAPYLNQSLLLLEYGVNANELADAAQSFGMPISPLQLMDWIGLRTAFDSGRVFWQAFPTRIDPSSILSGMLKAVRRGASSEARFIAAGQLTPVAEQVIRSYQRQKTESSAQAIMEIMALPMWIEAVEVLATGVVKQFEDIELAMAGGLGFQGSQGFFGFFDQLVRDAVLEHLLKTSQQFKSLRVSQQMLDCVRHSGSLSEAALEYVAMNRS